MLAGWFVKLIVIIESGLLAREINARNSRDILIKRVRPRLCWKNKREVCEKVCAPSRRTKI